jgi:hypothetical protein
MTVRELLSAHEYGVLAVYLSSRRPVIMTNLDAISMGWLTKWQLTSSKKFWQWALQTFPDLATFLTSELMLDAADFTGHA